MVYIFRSFNKPFQSGKVAKELRAFKALPCARLGTVGFLDTGQVIRLPVSKGFGQNINSPYLLVSFVSINLLRIQRWVEMQWKINRNMYLSPIHSERHGYICHQSPNCFYLHRNISSYKLTNLHPVGICKILWGFTSGHTGITIEWNQQQTYEYTELPVTTSFLESLISLYRSSGKVSYRCNYTHELQTEHLCIPCHGDIAFLIFLLRIFSGNHRGFGVSTGQHPSKDLKSQEQDFALFDFGHNLMCCSQHRGKALDEVERACSSC